MGDIVDLYYTLYARRRPPSLPLPVVVKQEPVELPDPMMAGVVIKQEPHSLDERADIVHGDMEVPEFLQDPGPSTEMLEPKPKKHKKEKKKKHNRGVVKEEIKQEDGVSQDSRQGGSSGGSTSGSNPATPEPGELCF